MKFEWDEARKTGKGDQNSINAVLRKYVEMVTSKGG